MTLSWAGTALHEQSLSGHIHRWSISTWPVTYEMVSQQAGVGKTNPMSPFRDWKWEVTGTRSQLSSDRVTQN